MKTLALLAVLGLTFSALPAHAEEAGPNPTPEISAKIASENYTDEERRNIQSTIAFINLPRDERRKMLAEDFKFVRNGMATAQRMSGLSTPGYSSESMNNRVDYIEDIIAKGDRVWVIWKMVGNHTGTWFGVPATGRPIEFREEAHLRYRDGRISEARFAAEELDIVEQLGIAVDFPAAGKR